MVSLDRLVAICLGMLIMMIVLDDVYDVLGLSGNSYTHPSLSTGGVDKEG